MNLIASIELALLLGAKPRLRACDISERFAALGLAAKGGLLADALARLGIKRLGGLDHGATRKRAQATLVRKGFTAGRAEWTLETWSMAFARIERAKKRALQAQASKQESGAGETAAARQLMTDQNAQMREALQAAAAQFAQVRQSLEKLQRQFNAHEALLARLAQAVEGKGGVWGDWPEARATADFGTNFQRYADSPRAPKIDTGANIPKGLPHP